MASTSREVIAALREGLSVEVPIALMRKHRRAFYAAWWEYGGSMVIVYG